MESDLPQPVIDELISRTQPNSDIALRRVMLAGGILVFFMSLLAGAAVMIDERIFENISGDYHMAGGSFGAFRLGTVSSVYLGVMLIYLVLFFVPQKRVATYIAIIVTIPSLIFLGAMFLAYLANFRLPMVVY